MNGNTPFTASDASSNDRFGWSVAYNGNNLAVGAPSIHGGKAYVFERGGPVMLPLPDVVVDSHFGFSIGVGGVDTVAVGAHTDTLDEKGSVHVYKQRDCDDIGCTWEQDPKLELPNGQKDDQFGWSIGVSEDKLIVGVPQGEEGRGSIYL